MVDLFISYAREDQAAVRQLAAVLEAQGWSVFWDRTIPAGETWRSYIGKALDDARCVVVVWSADSIESHWVQEEAEEARNKNILIPVLLTPVSPPIGFRSITAANLVGWAGDADDELFVQFRADISRKLGDPPALIEARERQRAEAERRARAQEAEQRREAELPPKRRGQQAAAGVNGESHASPTRKTTTTEPTPTRTKMAIALAVLVSMIAVIAWNRMPQATTKIPPATYALTVTTTPANASINIENVGRYAPGMRLEAGTYRVRASLAGYQAVERTFEVVGRDVALEMDLQPVTYGLTVTTTPPNASINIEDVGRYAPGMRLEAGTYRVRASLAGYQAMERTFEVAERDVALEMALQPAFPLPKLVRIPAGSFMMGSENGRSNERPVRAVHIDQPFYLGATEVTFEQYDAFAAATGRELPNDQDWGRDDRPIIKVSWNDAKAYAQWLGEETGNSCRLPSEAEWEYAARAGTESHYGLPTPAGGDDLSGYANCRDCGQSKDVTAELNEHIGKRTLPVASFPANAWGVHDMHGNVWEWVADCWHGSYQGAPVDGSTWLAENGGNCDTRVLRGGSWSSDRDFARSAFRFWDLPDIRDYVIGFRVLCSSPILSTDH